jgi:ABC-type Zn uptake system ZnuABC Zn-binding protein ZnuA
MPRFAAWITLILCALNLLACSKPAPTGSSGSPRILVTIPPLAGLVRPLTPQGGAVQTLIPTGRSEHGYELTPEDIATLAQADVVIYVGLGLDAQVEAFLRKHPNPARREVCFAKVVGISADGAAHEDPDHDDGHHHGGVDPHLWLDPDLCIKLVPALAAAVAAPGVAPSTSAADVLVARLKAFDDQARARLAPYKGRAIVTHHDAWRRLAEHYGLTVAAVIRPIEAADENSGAINDVIKAVQDQHLKEILVEPQFSDKAARRIAQETGVRVGKIDPLGDGDWFVTMQANIDAIASALAP